MIVRKAFRGFLSLVKIIPAFLFFYERVAFLGVDVEEILHGILGIFGIFLLVAFSVQLLKQDLTQHLMIQWMIEFLCDAFYGFPKFVQHVFLKFLEFVPAVQQLVE